MANIYVRSTDGSDADNGSTWALAKATLVGAGGIDAAGDTIWLSQSHNESTNSGFPSLAGSAASPQRLLCGNDAAEPPTALATTAAITVSGGAGNLLIYDYAYCYGITWTQNGTGAFQIGSAAGNTLLFEQCGFKYTAATGSARIRLANAYNVLARYVNCNARFAAASQAFEVTGTVHWSGGTMMASGSSTPTVLFSLTGGIVLLENCDLSGFASTMNIVSGYGRFVMRNCKLPASWSGTLINGTPGGQERYEMYNCDASDTNYNVWIEDAVGSTRSETTIVRTSGASDGTTPLSWKMATNADAEYPLLVATSPEICIWNEAVGSSKTVTIEFVHDTNVAAGQGAGTAYAFQNNEVWMEVSYLGTSGFPLGTTVRTYPADVLAAAADITSSSVTWTTTGMTTPVKQKLTASFTPQEKGFFSVKICLAKASKTIYVDPLITVS